MKPTSIDRLRRLAAHLFEGRAMELRIEPTLCDIHNECLEAHRCGQPWRARWIEVVGVLVFLKVVALMTLEREARFLQEDTVRRLELLRLGGIFAAAVAAMAVVLTWLPLNTMPVARPVDASEFLYLIPQAIPIAVPNGLLIAIVLGVRASLSSRLILSILSLAAICSVVSFLTLGWWAPASSQWYRTRVIGHDVARSENELTLGELGTRIDQIRAFDPDAPAIRLSVLYHNRWALSATPLIVAAFAVLIAGRNRRSPVGRVFWAVLSAGAFTLLLVWMNALAFRGSLSPPLGAWMANLSLLAVTSALMTDVLKRAADHVEKVAR